MRRDPRDALGTLLADAVAPVLGWPALYKCSSLSRAWRGKLEAIRAELRQHATPRPPFGLDGLDEALLFRVAPFLGCESREESWKTSVYEWACLFRLSPVSRAWNDAIGACARRALLQRMDTMPRAFRPDALLGADLERWHLHMKQQGFPDSETHDDDGYPWRDRSYSCYGYSCYGPRGVTLPSHVKALLLSSVGAATVKDGYAANAANTFLPLNDWRLVSSEAAGEAIQFADDGMCLYGFKKPFICIRAWTVPLYGEAEEVYQMVYLSLVDGLFYYYNNQTYSNRRCIGTAMDYLRGGWQPKKRDKRGEMSPWPDARQNNYYHVPGASMIVHSEDPAEQQGITNIPPPDMDLNLSQRNARDAAHLSFGDPDVRVAHQTERGLRRR